MKFLVASDFHPDVVTFGVPRFSEVKDAFRQTIESAHVNEVDAYIFLGDLADPDQGAATLRSVEMLAEGVMANARKGIPSILIAGNHDVCEDGSGATTLTPLRSIERYYSDLVHVCEQPRLIHLSDSHDFLALPYAARSHAYNPAERVRSMWPARQMGTKVIVGGHLMIDGVTPGEETHEMPRGREIAFPMKDTAQAVLRMNGHYHARQTTKEGIEIPGSLARLFYGEHKNEPSYLLVEV